MTKIWMDTLKEPIQMNKAINSIRLFFCFFSGEDDFIIRKCNWRIQFSFAAIGLFVILIFIGCWFSASLFMSHIFDGSKWISIPLGIIWAFLFIILYLLILYTISPRVLPFVRKKMVRIGGKGKKVINNDKRSEFPLSLILRIAIIVLLAVIIAQPFNVWIFAPSFEENDMYATEIREIFSHKYEAQIITLVCCVLFLLPIYFKYKIRNLSRKYFDNDFEGKNSGNNIKELRENLTKPKDFNEVSKKILSLDLNAIKTSDFYFQKTLIEYRIIIEEYEKFKLQYCDILYERNDVYAKRLWQNIMQLLNKLEEINYSKKKVVEAVIMEELKEAEFIKFEYWADPPFRTIQKNMVKEYGTEAELLKSFYK